MRECFVSFASAADVQEFVAIATRQGYPIHVERDGMRTSAKSIMSVFSMGLHRPLRVVIGDAKADSSCFFSAVQPYLVA